MVHQPPLAFAAAGALLEVGVETAAAPAIVAALLAAVAPADRSLPMRQPLELLLSKAGLMEPWQRSKRRRQGRRQ